MFNTLLWRSFQWVRLVHFLRVICLAICRAHSQAPIANLRAFLTAAAAVTARCGAHRCLTNHPSVEISFQACIPVHYWLNLCVLLASVKVPCALLSCAIKVDSYYCFKNVTFRKMFWNNFTHNCIHNMQHILRQTNNMNTAVLKPFKYIFRNRFFTYWKHFVSDNMNPLLYRL